jgi:hypothetical protein
MLASLPSSTWASAASVSVGVTARPEMISPLRSNAEMWSVVRFRISTRLATTVAAPARSTRTTMLPDRTAVAASTLSPTVFSAGRASPVSTCWSTLASPRSMRPSTGIVWPALTTTRSPTARSANATSVSTSSRRTHALRGSSPNTLFSLCWERRHAWSCNLSMYP